MKRHCAIAVLALAAWLGLANVTGAGNLASAQLPKITLGRGVDRELSDAEIAKIEAALPTEAPAKPQKPRKILICTLATGYVHSSIPVGAKAFEMMGKKLGTWDAVISHDKEMFAPDKLAEFDAVLMESTTGELFGLHKG